MLLFVYGTLKRGGENHRLLAGQRFVAEARTVAEFKLYQLEGYPGLVPVFAGGNRIEGELWEVGPASLEELDRFEGTDVGLFARRRIPLDRPHESESVEGYLYLGEIAGRRDLGSSFP